MLLGAAICGAVSVGLFGGIAEAARKLVKTDKRYEPNAQTVKVYEEIYGIYCAAYEALSRAKVFERIAEIQK